MKNFILAQGNYNTYYSLLNCYVKVYTLKYLVIFEGEMGVKSVNNRLCGK